MSSPSVVGFPKSLSNEIEFTLPDSVESFNVKIAPSNGSSFASATQTLTASSSLNLNGSNTNIIFDLPTGVQSQFWDGRFAFLNFRVAYEITNTPSAAVITAACLRSHANAHFDTMTILSQSGVVLEQITNYGMVNDMLLQNEINVADRDSLACMYGLQYEAAGAVSALNNNQGHKLVGIDAVTLGASTIVYYSYSVPILSSLLGKGASKMMQLATNKLQLQLTTSAIAPVTIVTGTATTAALFKYTIDNVSISAQIVDIGNEGVRLLGKTGMQYYNGVTYKVSSGLVPAGASGSLQLLAGIRGSSVRALFLRAVESGISTAASLNFIYDSKAPQATSLSWLINGKQYPSNPVDLLHNPAQVFTQTQCAIGNFHTSDFKSGLVPSEYFIFIPGGTIPNDSDAAFTAAGSATAAVSQAQFNWGLNLERISKAGVMDGMNLNSSNTFLNVTLANGATNSITMYFIAKMDALYILDTATGEMTVRM
jgi:hypothetical protein